MRAGSLRHLVYIQTPTATKDDAGGWSDTWATLADGEVWADIRPASGAYTDRLLGAKVAGSATHLVTIRYVQNVSTKCRVLFGSRTFNVRGVANLDERGRLLVLACEESNT